MINFEFFWSFKFVTDENTIHTNSSYDEYQYQFILNRLDLQSTIKKKNRVWWKNFWFFSLLLLWVIFFNNFCIESIKSEFQIRCCCLVAFGFFLWLWKFQNSSTKWILNSGWSFFFFLTGWISCVFFLFHGLHRHTLFCLHSIMIFFPNIIIIYNLHSISSFRVLFFFVPNENIHIFFIFCFLLCYLYVENDDDDDDRLRMKLIDRWVHLSWDFSVRFIGYAKLYIIFIHHMMKLLLEHCVFSMCIVMSEMVVKKKFRMFYKWWHEMMFQT